jgi:CDP-diacylglycerol--serine O-phosphatidyltransferase
VAPAYLTMRLVSQYWTEEGSGVVQIVGPEADDFFAKVLWAVAAAYVCCAALRLARFNVESGSPHVKDHLLFRGLPSPGAAGALASLIILHQHWLAVRWGVDPPPDAFARATAFSMAFVMLICAFGMVSSIPYVHLLNRYVRRRASFGFTVRLVLLMILVVFRPWEMLAILFTAYALSGPVRLAWHRLKRRRLVPASAAARSAEGDRVARP